MATPVLKDPIPGEMFDGIDFVVQGAMKNKKGRLEPNPKPIPKKKGSKIQIGLSVKVQREIARGQIQYFELCCWNAAWNTAELLDLKQDDRVNFYGRYEFEMGHTREFHKMHVNGRLQIERFSAITATPTEI
ncbi:MAG: hypothetical protein JRE40_12735 [Deltaproteobacteria bacterium]|nr:hypothetical protein [Deltaproteobacteria bacterium]